MKTLLRTVLALSLAINFAKAEELTQDQVVKKLNSINQRLEKGEVKALDEVKTLPAKDIKGAYLMFFNANFYAYQAPAFKKEIALTCARNITAAEGAEEFFALMWKKPEGAQAGTGLPRQAAIDCLGAANNKFGVRVLLNALSETDLGEQRKEILRVLQNMDIPGAPYPKWVYPAQYPKGSLSREGLEKWQAWWEKNKAAYAPEAK